MSVGAVGSASGASSINPYLAALLGRGDAGRVQPITPTSTRDMNLQSAREADRSIRSDAAQLEAKAGSGASVIVQYQYNVGPDGQLYVTGATVQSSKRTRGPRDASPIAQQEGVAAQPLQLQDARPRSFASLARPQAMLSPSDEAAIYGSDDFLNDTLNSNESNHRARLQLADFGVRSQERQHFAAAFGLGSLPHYDYDVGPDGELYAVAGRVDVSTGPAANEWEAARDAATLANAALAATDVSAQDISAARNALSRAAGLYAANRDRVMEGNPVAYFNA